MKKNVIVGLLAALFLASCAFFHYVPLSDIPPITKEELVKQLNDPNLTILDVRVDQDWTDSRQKIKGAVREEPREFLAWAPKYSKDSHIVLYCE